MIAIVIWSGALLIAALLIAFVSIFALIKYSKYDPLGFSEASGDPSPPNPFRAAPVGTKPLSVHLSGIVCRFGKKTHLYTDDLFWKNFEDGPWKWDSRGRYAGSGLNPGHYFAFSGHEARSELQHYIKDENSLHDYKLLVIDGHADNILDLTSVENIRRLAEELRILNNPFDIMGQLVTAATGGTYFTDAFGAYAYERGYSGILFFSARNIEENQRSHLQSEGYYHEDDELTFKSFTASDMFSQPKNRCIVFFNGAEVVRSIKRYYIAGNKTEPNPYYGVQTDVILQKSKDYGVEYQEQRKLHRGCPLLLRGTPRCLRCAD